MPLAPRTVSRSERVGSNSAKLAIATSSICTCSSRAWPASMRPENSCVNCAGVADSSATRGSLSAGKTVRFSCGSTKRSKASAELVMSVCRTGRRMTLPGMAAALSSATTMSLGTPLHGDLKPSVIASPASIANGTP